MGSAKPYILAPYILPLKKKIVSPTVSWLIWKPPVLYVGPNRAITRTKNHLTSSIPTQQPPPPLRVEDNTERFKPNGVLGWKDIGPFLPFGCDGRRRRAHASAKQAYPRRIQRNFRTKHLRIERSVHSSVPVLEEVSDRTYVPLRSTTTTAMGFPLRRFFLSPQRLLFHRLGYWRPWSYLECEDKRGSEIILVGG